LVEGRALKLHPLVCTAYNADFDGDQMAVHVPLSAEAQAEARFLMLAANNLLKPSDGKPVAVPTQDMVLGSYYLTVVKPDEPGANKVFRDTNEAIMAYQDGVVGLHAPIRVRMEKDGEKGLTWCTVGFIIFNQSIPQNLGFVDRSKPENKFRLEICFTPKDENNLRITSGDEINNFKVGKKQLGKIIDHCIKLYGTSETAIVLDNIKATGFKYSTRGAITVAVSDAIIPPQKKDIIANAEKKIDEVKKMYRRGFLTNTERLSMVIKTWNDATDEIADALKGNLDEFNPIFMMADSGARGSMSQIKLLAGMRGLISNTSGAVIEIPIRANYREGLNVLEYFISSRGARKGLADTALRTADSGYLTRRMVDVSQDVIIREDDCGTVEGLKVSAIMEGNQVIERFEERLQGRFLLEPVVDPATGEVLVNNDHMMTDDDAEKIVNAGYDSVYIRSILCCRSKHGVCKKCYGMNLATGLPVTVGEAVGIIAAQSIGEPGTQLTMRTFHTGGIASTEDITQGLPRVEELFEARRPKHSAILAEIDGTATLTEDKKNRVVIITDEENADERKYTIPFGYRLSVAHGDTVKKGQQLTEGSIAPADILATTGPGAVEEYIIKEIQNAYRSQGVEINDKHIEVIIRQMMRKFRIVNNGSTSFIPNTMVDRGEVYEANDEIQARIDAGEEGLSLATYEYTLLGITKASLATESFLSAASFQETTRVLTDAAIKGKVDPLFGLKENVIIGKLVPAGTGMKCYQVNEDEEAEVEDVVETAADFEENAVEVETTEDNVIE
ncbi:MAG: DNA-directed RNA polymerase subunit beta', partial [Clostridia bacterium]|nr:DNA-directed RNA polymerase subunit beta' [Clostridia bacterium]